ncbi:LysR family transcriptional regulator [Actinomadura sediminis]|uniref:LysR family transcriptional regulator n=1 Tax=Actinomadura sediminis TaxID=1038904 RepID=A0ABW3F1X8_9ACTN
MNLRQLRYVVATADHGTMTSAAQALYVAQPALSRAVRELERELGLELFARSGRGVVLTPVGEQVVRRARAALEAVDAIEGLSAARGHRPGAELRIATTAALEPELTGRLVPLFAREQPAVRIRVVRCADGAAVAAALRAGRADLGLAGPPAPADLAAHPLTSRAVLAHLHRRTPPAGRDFLVFARDAVREPGGEPVRGAPGGRGR